MSTVVDAGGGVPGSVPQPGKCLLWSTPVAASRGAYHSRENVYCGRRRWRRPGERTTAGKMSTVVDAGGGVPGSVPQPGKCLLWSTPVAASRGAFHSRENIYCSRRGDGAPAAGRSR
ncbi:hypothetical protein [Raoultella ornithinolytica]|uniref:hypothetical protein n=1 Tax=Raoultella ornithinolytica TaxID=54291 RepID=UPI0012DB2996|nr:hypothetical protein [Raoultella ornithinolytica]